MRFSSQRSHGASEEISLKSWNSQRWERDAMLIPKSMSNGFRNVKSTHVAFIVRKYSELVALQELLHRNHFVPKCPNECFEYLIRCFGAHILH